MIRKWLKKLLAPIVQEAVEEVLCRALDISNDAVVKTKLPQNYTLIRPPMTQEEMRRYIDR